MSLIDSSSCCSSAGTRDIEIDVVGDEDTDSLGYRSPTHTTLDLSATSVEKSRRLNPFSIESLLSGSSGLRVTVTASGNSDDS